MTKVMYQFHVQKDIIDLREYLISIKIYSQYMMQAKFYQVLNKMIMSFLYHISCNSFASRDYT